jgi:hypothetical protein
VNLALLIADEDAVTALDILTLTVAILGLALALVTFVWQTVTFRLTGPVIQLRAGVGKVFPINEDVVNATASNTGRAPVQISTWGFCYLKRRARHFFRRRRVGTALFVASGMAGSPRPPVTVEGGHDVTFWADRDALAREMPEAPRRSTLHAWVALATGKVMYSPGLERPTVRN